MTGNDHRNVNDVTPFLVWWRNRAGIVRYVYGRDPSRDMIRICLDDLLIYLEVAEHAHVSKRPFVVETWVAD